MTDANYAILERLGKKEVRNDYTYYQIPSPWLQIKCMRVLQYFPPPEDPALRKPLTEVLRRTIAASNWAGARVLVRKPYHCSLGRAKKVVKKVAMKVARRRR